MIKMIEVIKTRLFTVMICLFSVICFGSAIAYPILFKKKEAKSKEAGKHVERTVNQASNLLD